MPARCLVLVFLAVAVAACGETGPTPDPEPDLPPEVTPALARLLGDVDGLPNEDVAARTAELIDREPGTMDALVAILRVDHSSRRQRGRALVVIESQGPAAMPVLLRFFLANDDQVAERAYIAIRHVLPAANSWIASEPFPLDNRWTAEHDQTLGAFEAALIERARGGSTHVRRYAAMILSAFPPGARSLASIPVLTDAVMHDDPAIVSDAACALMASADKAHDAVPRLLRLLDSGDEDARDLAFAILERIGPHDRAVPAAFMERAERTDDEELKCSLLVAVSAMGPLGRSAVPLLGRELRSGDADRMRSAANCLVAIGPASIDALTDVLDNGTLAARILAARTLARLGAAITPRARDALALHAESEDPDLAAAAQAALDALPPG